MTEMAANRRIVELMRRRCEAERRLMVEPSILAQDEILRALNGIDAELGTIRMGSDFVRLTAEVRDLRVVALEARKVAAYVYGSEGMVALSASDVAHLRTALANVGLRVEK